jgi:hypothetical protein
MNFNQNTEWSQCGRCQKKKWVIEDRTSCEKGLVCYHNQPQTLTKSVRLMYLSVSDSKHSCVHFQVLTLVPGIVSARAVPKPLQSRVVSLIYVFPSARYSLRYVREGQKCRVKKKTWCILTYMHGVEWGHLTPGHNSQASVKCDSWRMLDFVCLSLIWVVQSFRFRLTKTFPFDITVFFVPRIHGSSRESRVIDPGDNFCVSLG